MRRTGTIIAAAGGVLLGLAATVRGQEEPAPVPSDAVPSDAVPSDTVPSDTVPSDSEPSGTVPSNGAAPNSGPSEGAVGAMPADGLPSGLDLALQEIILEDQGDDTFWVRFRYVAPAVAAGGYEAVAHDFAVLCTLVVLPWAAAQERKIAQAVISIAAEPVEFGTSAPGVAQFFEAFRLSENGCIWEAF